MQVLIGPRVDNNFTDDDYCYTDVGEHLFTWDCPHDDCGKHSFIGADSDSHSAYAEVVEVAISPDELFAVFSRAMGMHGEVDASALDAAFSEQLGLFNLLSLFAEGSIITRAKDGSIEIAEQFAPDAKIYPFPSLTAA